MKTEINYFIKVSIISSLKFLVSSLVIQGKYFIFFPHYWELIPLNLEKAIAHKNIEKKSDRKDNIN